MTSANILLCCFFIFITSRSASVSDGYRPRDRQVYREHPFSNPDRSSGSSRSPPASGSNPQRVVLDKQRPQQRPQQKPPTPLQRPPTPPLSKPPKQQKPTPPPKAPAPKQSKPNKKSPENSSGYRTPVNIHSSDPNVDKGKKDSKAEKEFLKEMQEKSSPPLLVTLFFIFGGVLLIFFLLSFIGFMCTRTSSL